MNWLTRIRQWFHTTPAEDRESGKQYAIKRMAQGIPPHIGIMEIHSYSFGGLDAFDRGAVDEFRRHL